MTSPQASADDRRDPQRRAPAAPTATGRRVGPERQAGQPPATAGRGAISAADDQDRRADGGELGRHHHGVYLSPNRVSRRRPEQRQARDAERAEVVERLGDGLLQLGLPHRVDPLEDGLERLGVAGG